MNWKSWKLALLRRSVPKRRFENLYQQLANIRVFFDLEAASDDELVMVWLNTWTLVDGLTKEMQRRGMDPEQIIDATKAAFDDGTLGNG
ncbi:TPA: hypothetical protein ACK3RK_006094 [Burkholderia cepacia]